MGTEDEGGVEDQTGEVPFVDTFVSCTSGQEMEMAVFC